MATLALLSWPILGLYLFARLSPVSGIIWVTLLPYLYLPEAFKIDLSGLPDIDKELVISATLALCLIVHKRKIHAELGPAAPQVATPLVRTGLRICALVFFAGLIITVLNNRDTLVYGPTVVPGARPWDALSQTVSWAARLFPFIVALQYLRKPEAHRALLHATCIAALAYSLLMVVEIRLSPQMHVWVYGFRQHSFLQHMRNDGFRPMVFLSHGLSVGFFIFMALMAAAALWKSTKDSKWLWCTLWMLLILFMSKNLGAFLISLLLLGVLFTFGQTLQRWFLLFTALFVLMFPVLRQAEIISTEPVVEMAKSLSEDRAQSLQFRMINEDALLDRAWERKWTGWGGWGRNQVYNEFGQYEATFDGLWIIRLGVSGWIGYLSLFGLLIIPVVALALMRRVRVLPPETLGLAFIAAGNLLYLIPNSTLSPIGLLVFGAVAGFAVYNAQPLSETKTMPKERNRALRYTRFTSQRPRRNT